MGDYAFSDTLDNLSLGAGEQTPTSSTNPTTPATNNISFDDSLFLCQSDENNEDEADASNAALHVTTICESSLPDSTTIGAPALPIDKLRQSFLEKSRARVELSEELSTWGLPSTVLDQYAKRNITQMFQWQFECLNNAAVLDDQRNLVYSAPTSAGKTFVSEMLAIKTILERKKKVLFILPFISVVREKMFYFQDILSTSGVRVDGFMGSYNPPGGFQQMNMAVCTMEKANSLVNRMLDEGTLQQVGAIIVDELHLLGDPARGYLLELLLTKLLYMNKRCDDIQIQIVGMSATLPNLPALAEWLDAALYVTDFRPIPLQEMCYVNGILYDNHMGILRKLEALPGLDNDTDNILQLCLETIAQSCSVLVFCPAKNWCENLAQQVAGAFFKVGTSDRAVELKSMLRSQLDGTAIVELREQLSGCPVGLDAVLKKTVSFGVAFHHAGLTMDERDIVEAGFKNGAIRVLVATSTLSSGVNLPARRVIIRSPKAGGRVLDSMTYRQMIGRAGRMGKDTLGESILVCKDGERYAAQELMCTDLKPVQSCLEGAGKLKRAILEVISSGVASTEGDVALFTDCTLLACMRKSEPSQLQSTSKSSQHHLCDPIAESLHFLLENELIRKQKSEIENGSVELMATALAKACLSASVSPEDGLALFCELERARRCFVLDTELHLVYLVTPLTACYQWGELDWLRYMEMWEQLSPAMRRVGELVGVKVSYILRGIRNGARAVGAQAYAQLQVHKRFFVALALQDLVNEVPLNDVAEKFACNRGMLQSLQQSASTFAGMVTAFSRQLGWRNVELLIGQFQDRMQFGVARDLLDLMRIPYLTGTRARVLFDAGIETLSHLATAIPSVLEGILRKSLPFVSERNLENVDDGGHASGHVKRVWISGLEQAFTERDATLLLIKAAQEFLRLELGLDEVKWINAESKREEIDERTVQPCSEISMQEDHMKVQEKAIITSTVASIQTVPNVIDSKPSNIEDQINVKVEKVSDPEQVVLIKSADTGTLNESVDNMFEDSLSLEIKSQQQVSIDSEDNKDVVSTTSEMGNVKLIFCGNVEIKQELASSHEQVACSKYPNTEMLNKSINNMLEDCLLLDDVPLDIQLPNPKVENDITKDIVSTTSEVPIPDGKTNDSDYDIFDDSLSNENPLRNKNDLKAEIIPDHISKQIQTTTDASKMFGDSIRFEEFSFKPQHLEEYQVKMFDDSFDVNAIEVKISGQNTTKLKNDSALFEHDSELEQAFITSFNISTSSTDCLSESPQVTPARNQSRKRILSDTEHSFTPKKPCLGQVKSGLDCVEVVDIGSNLQVIEVFQSELQTHNDLALALACEKIELEKSVIGRPSSSKSSDTHSNAFRSCKIVGVAIAWEANIVYFIDFESKNKVVCLELFKTLLSRTDCQLRMFDAKEQIKLLKRACNFDISCKIADPKVAEWLLNPGVSEQNFHTLCLNYCAEVTSIPSIRGYSSSIGSKGLSIDNKIKPRYRAATEAVCIWHIFKHVMAKLNCHDDQLSKTFEIEMEIIKILALMEVVGIGVDVATMEALTENLKSQAREIEQKVYSAAGKRFSMTSSKEVAKVIGLFAGKKVSTNKQVLESSDRPIAKLILSWRKLNVTLTHMVYPLVRAIDTESRRIHGKCITHSATGRISMHEPNVQNIPRDFDTASTTCEREVSCRRAFVPRSGSVLVAADYCQLELRVLAHYSADKNLVRAMKRGSEDVFKLIAARWHNVDVADVTDELRQRAKKLCYGIVYGMGNKAVADQLGVDEDEAVTLQETFHATYPGIRRYINETVQQCRASGYVKTIAGRKRYLPNINHEHSASKAQAERQAVNTMIQGTASDLVKRAMMAVDAKIQAKFRTCKQKPQLVLQIHDELLYEVPDKYAPPLCKILRYVMETVVQLSVSFPVKIKTGPSWGDMHEVVD